MIAHDLNKALVTLVSALVMFASGAVLAAGHQDAPAAASVIDEEELTQLPATERSLADLLPELVTTARRTEENVLEVPVAITNFSADQIRNAGINSIDDVAASTPGFSVQNFFGQDLNKPVIRGVAPVDIFGQANTAIYIDGIYVSSSTGINFGFLDIERIEVLKGPQGAYFGNNAFSGAVNYVSKTPGDELATDLEVQVGEDGKQLFRGTISGPLVDNILSASLSGLYDDYDGGYGNAAGRDQDIGGRKYKALSGSLFFTPNEALSAKWNLYLGDDAIDPPAATTIPTNCEPSTDDGRLLNVCGELPSVGENDLATIPGETGQTRTVFRTSLNLDWETTVGTISYLAGYSETKDQTFQNGNPGQSNTVVSYAPDPSVIIGNTPFPPFFDLFETRLFDAGGLLQNSIGKVKNTDLSQELRFTSPQENRLRYTVGAYYFNQEVKSPRTSVSVTAENPLPADYVIGTSQFCALCADFIPATPGSSGSAFNPIPGFLPPSVRFFGTSVFLPWYDGTVPVFDGLDESEFTDWAFFGSAEYDLTDALTGYVELRYTDRKEKRKLTDAMGAPQTLPASEYDTDYITWRGSLSWAMNDYANLYGSIATGEKGGGLSPFTIDGGVRDGEEVVFEYGNEKNTTYELGYKAAYYDGKLILDSAIYFIDWEDIVLRNLISEFEGVSDFQPVAIQQNLGDADIFGIELGLSGQFNDNWSGGLGFAYNDTELARGASDRYAEFPSFAPDGDVSGQELPRQPDTQVNANLTFRDQLRGDWDWYARGDVFYQSSWYVDLPNQAEVPSRTTVNARIGIESDVYTVELYATNLFDEDSAIAGYRDVYFSTVTQDTFQNQFFPWRMTVQQPERRIVALRLIGRF